MRATFKLCEMQDLMSLSYRQMRLSQTACLLKTRLLCATELRCSADLNQYLGGKRCFSCQSCMQCHAYSHAIYHRIGNSILLICTFFMRKLKKSYLKITLICCNVHGVFYVKLHSQSTDLFKCPCDFCNLVLFFNHQHSTLPAFQFFLDPIAVYI